MANDGKPPVPVENTNAADENKPPEVPPPSAKFQKRMAAAVLILFTIFSLLALCFALRVGDSTWLRIVFIYQGIQAVAFTAVGWVFGREVNRDGLKTMQELKDGAEKKANQAQKQAEKQKATIARIEGASLADAAATARQAGSGERPRSITAEPEPGNVTTQGKSLADVILDIIDKG